MYVYINVCVYDLCSVNSMYFCFADNCIQISKAYINVIQGQLINYWHNELIKTLMLHRLNVLSISEISCLFLLN